MWTNLREIYEKEDLVRVFIRDEITYLIKYLIDVVYSFKG